MSMQSPPHPARSRPLGSPPLSTGAVESPAAAAAAALLASEGSAASASSSASAAAQHTDKIKRIGDWILGETLGQGSFGKVKLAHHAKTKEKVAIKIVDKSCIANVEDVERVYRETFILTTLKHGNIIKLFEVLDTPKSIMLVMEYAGGGELFSFVAAKHRLDEVESCRLFQQIISGVEYCHRAKIIHRDLKLENILLDKQGQVKIADFGLSNSIKFGQKMDTSCLTPDHSVLVRSRGWTPIAQVRQGDRVWALQFLGSERAAWTRVVGLTSRPLRRDEPLLHFHGRSTEILCTQDHAMWTKHAQSGAWAVTPAADTETRRHVLLAAPPADEEDYPWQLPFLPPSMTRDQDEAWCVFLGCFLGAGTLRHDDAASTKTVLISARNTDAVCRVATLLQALGWLHSSPEEAAASRLSGNLMPCFTQQLDGTFSAVHSELFDFLQPMISGACSSAASADAVPVPLPMTTSRSETEPVRMRGRAPAPVLVSSLGVAAAAAPSMPALFSAVAATARAVESARVAGTGTAAHAIMDPFAHRLLSATACAPVVDDAPISLALHLSHGPPRPSSCAGDPAPSTLSALQPALALAQVPLGPHVLISELVPIAWKDGCDRELDSLLCGLADGNDLAAVPPPYASIAQQSVQAVLACGPKVVVAFGRHAGHCYNELPKSARASYIDGLRCYALSSNGTIVIEAPHPSERGPDTAQRVALALTLAQQLLDGAVLPAPEQMPCATAVDLCTDDEATLPAAVSEKPLDPHRSLFYSWRFYLGPRQCRAVIAGWALGAGAMPCLNSNEQQLEKDGSAELLQGFTSSRALVDELGMLAARAGYPCVVRAHPQSAAPTDSESASIWCVEFRRSVDSKSTAAVEAPLSDDAAELVTKHSFTHVHCITTLAGNFLVRRDLAAADSGEDAARPQASVFIGNCGTPSYTCPEQINGKKYVGSSADIWSLGVILFAMISGFLPFEASGIPALFKKIKNRQYKAPDYLSREAADLIERMLTLEADKRASISEIRNHPWMLMEYTDLAEIIEARKEVTPDMVAEARIQCMAVGDEQAQAAAAQASAHAAANQAHAQARNKFAAGHAKSGSVAMPAGAGVMTAAAGGTGTGALSRALVLPLASSDSSLPSGSPCASPTPNDDDSGNGNGAKSGSSSAEREGAGYHAAAAASSAAAQAGVRPRERGSILMQPNAVGPTAGAHAHPKGFRDTRNNGGVPGSTANGMPPSGGAAAATNAANAAAAKGRAMSIFDKLSVRTAADGKFAEPHSAGAGVVPNGPLSAGTGVGAARAGVRFPPIGSPSVSPQFGEPAHAYAAAQPSSAKGGANRAAMTNHGAGGAPSSAGGRIRRPSEFAGAGGAGLPSYMQPTENAQNHLLASEREEREKAEAAESTSAGGGRSGGARRHGPISSPPPSSGGGGDRPSKMRGVPVLSERDRERERVDRERAALNELHDEFYSNPAGLERERGHSGAGMRDRDATTAAAVAAALREKKTPRARDGSIIGPTGGGGGVASTTAGHIPAYMLETNSSRQRGGSKHADM